ncbi:MAG: flagellar hook capping FlgD N-terminal domain-containing protein [Rubrivivax sp.]|nr:flagellar hook capping FlgD N-terminal domain-containing protein [Rubrivivax sp.]MDP3082865.1 flagellar hook capping FlgD N-terminal domain-containing protein [Rubrivivax sp.]
MTTIDTLSASTAAKTGTASAQSEAGSSERFLKLLVTQMQNQDPLNPMDNAQITSQMAQIQTVSGIERLNTSIQSIGGQFMQMQALQGASLVGRDVILEGNRLSVNDAGQLQGGFELASAADSVRVEILSGAGAVLDTIDLGAQSNGRHGFDWTPKPGVDPALGDSFRVVAKAGAASVASTALMRDRVVAVATGGDTLNLELRRSGTVPYGQIKSVN